MIAIQKIDAVYQQLFGANPMRTPDDWDTLCKRLVYLKLAKVHEISAIDSSALLYPLNLDNFKAIIRTKFASPFLTQSIEETEENALRLGQLKDLIGRWQRHGLSNDEVKTLLQLKRKLGANLQRQREQLESAQKGLAQLCEPLIQVKETLQPLGGAYTSFDYVKLA